MSFGGSAETSRSSPVRKPRPSGLKATNAMPSSRQASSTATSALRVHSEYSVCTAASGCTRVRPAHGGGRDLAQADRPDLAGLDQVGQRADAVFDRHALVPAVQVVEVDDVGLQPRQAVVAVRLMASGGRRSRAGPARCGTCRTCWRARTRRAGLSASPMSVSLAPKP